MCVFIQKHTGLTVYCSHHWKQQSSQASIDNFSDVGVVEGATYPEHADGHDRNQREAVANIEIITILQIT